MSDERALLKRIASWPDDGRDLALAFVLRTWGSSPRPVGSLLAVSISGAFEGSVSGGCVENAVIEEAGDVIRTGISKRLSYGVSNELAWDLDLPCGGTIEILLIRAPHPAIAKQLLTSFPVTLITNIDSGEVALCSQSFWSGNLSSNAALRKISLEALASGESQLETQGSIEYFLRPFSQPWRLIIIGAVHIAQPLAAMAQNAGFEVTIIEPRINYATQARFEDIKLVHDWPDSALSNLATDERCAIVTLSHDPKIDDLALITALDSPACYIGALGSIRNHQVRLKRLVEGASKGADLTRIRGPIGLDIGGNLPSEIAISILAEIIATRHGKFIGANTN